MAHFNMMIHCTGVTARAANSGNAEWVNLTFVGGDDRTEITLFFEANGLAALFAAHVGAFGNERAATEAAAPSVPEEEIVF